jgi:NADH:ubiquinone oxidoreductase subunit F (NADH-binding)
LYEPATRIAPRGLPRLLAGLREDGAALTLGEHERVHGPLPDVDSQTLIAEVDLAGLRGRGGADFPTSRKLEAVARRKRPAAVIVNGSETEPASGKDLLLLSQLPHLVLDGALLAARATGAEEIVFKVGDDQPAAMRGLRSAIEMRPEPVEMSIVAGPRGYVTGEETAVINLLNKGVAVPTLIPPRPFDRGYRGRPSLVQNPETLAQIALIARFGAAWFRELGTVADPGSVLVTISGAVPSPGVYELAFGTAMSDLLDAAGGPSEPLQAVLIGGYFGTWTDAEHAAGLRLARDELRSVGCALGSGVIIALGESSCGLHESARLIEYLADQSAAQCGPCVFGLRAIADLFTAVTEGIAHESETRRILRWSDEVRGRGACHHPDGAVRFVQSALRIFGEDIGAHRRRRCHARPAGLPVPSRSAAGGATRPARMAPRVA